MKNLTRTILISAALGFGLMGSAFARPITHTYPPQEIPCSMYNSYQNHAGCFAWSSTSYECVGTNNTLTYFHQSGSHCYAQLTIMLEPN